jgi:integrase
MAATQPSGGGYHQEKGGNEMRLKDRQLPSLPDGVHADGANNLALRVRGKSRTWQVRTLINGKRKTQSLGPYPAVSLRTARDKAMALAQAVAAGADPFAAAAKAAAAPTFAEAAELVHAEVKAGMSNGKHREQWINTVRTYANPHIGHLRLNSIEQADIRAVLAPIWATKNSTATRVLQRILAVMDWAVAKGYRETELPVRALRKSLPKGQKRETHHAALNWEQMPQFWQLLETCEGIGASALRFAILTAARSGEVRGATWGEVDMARALWAIPADRMKARRPHNVPLSPAALALLQRQRTLHIRLHGKEPAPHELVFAGMKAGQPLSDMSLTAVLRRMKRGDLTAHGFRSTFRDWVAEATSYAGELAEAALAHTIANRVEAAYRRGDLLERRRELMDAWAEYATATKNNALAPLKAVGGADTAK